MVDFPYSCELLVRKIFQCEQYEDPLGRLANADSWIFVDDEYDIEFKCQAWAVISRLQNEYLDSIEGREEIYQLSKNLAGEILNSQLNSELKSLMAKIQNIVEHLDLSEFPRINYDNTNDPNRS
ncbi:DUF3387 domain-containing protein [Chryseobacterium salipaludis]|uniref:DUF3387 domain-containing protein n=1 Tax=Chryseobacterium TaxID=59732 RepID=UPI001FF39543|nr:MULTISPECIES: DUF3387 domain-containing protein [Chryseobacterium]MCJ8498789.1 DUF3387 domain-containing protein [Chryseobacterium salipaludis]MCX3297357.1 DUF3387 domain-containing protein [Planobacterium sp. JC490]